MDTSSIEWTSLSDYRDVGISHLRKTARNNVPFEEIPKHIDPPIQGAWWAALEPGGFVIPHIDAGPPFYERWHIPVQPAGFFWEDGTYYEPTEPFMVKHWLPHAVWNPTDQTRIHLMVERKVIPPEAPESSKLILTEMIPEIAEMIASL